MNPPTRAQKRIKVKVVRQIALGLLVELPNGQTGIIRVREISWNDDRRQNWQDQWPVGWSGWAMPLEQHEGQPLELSLRLAESDPWNELPTKFDPQEEFDGVVTGVVAYGAFIELAPGLTGLLHQSRFPAWIKTPPLDLFWPGDRVRVCVLDVNHQERRISLTIPPVSPSPVDGINSRQPLKGLAKRQGPTSLDEFLNSDTPAKHILLVEDEPEQAMAVSNWLRRVRQRVDVVNSAESALDFLEKSQPDLALIDVGLPQMDGAKLAKIILEKWPKIAVISTTDWARADDMMEILDDLKANGAELLIKPLIPEDLIGILQKANKKNSPDLVEKNSARLPALPLTDIPNLKANRPFQDLLQQCRKQLGFEQAILFSLDPTHRTATVAERSGEAIFDKNAIPSLIFSPVRDVAEDHITLIINEIQAQDQNRFHYLLELCPSTVACIGVPVPAQLQLDYALFILDKHPRQITQEQIIYAEAMALALGASIEQQNFKEKSMLIQRTALIGHLTRAMVHEINNLVGPLSSRLDNLQLNIKLLEKNPNRPGIQESRNRLISGELDEIQNNIRKIINTTRMFGRIAAKGKNEILRVDEIVEETIHFLRDTSDRSHVTIGFEPPDQLLVIRSQAAALEQVLLNVLLNAVQQIAELRPDSGGWVQVRMEINCDGSKSGFFRVLIEDNGPGIHASLWNKIFEAGYTTRHDGSGIGLYISRNLIEEMGGKIYIQESCILGGTIFALEIPCQL
ncbi:MAG: response regulator [Chloroflexi bacterium]|nr:response regulator [Chloroflexota bacterium]